MDGEVQHPARGVGTACPAPFERSPRNPVVKQIADAHGKTPAQVALRQHIQRGIVVIPKSVHKERMKQNMDIFDFKLTDNEMEQLKMLDENKSMWAEYDDPMIVQYAMAEE